MHMIVIILHIPFSICIVVDNILHINDIELKIQK